jgi:hypothetical protein
LLKPHGDTLFGRIGSAGALRSASVLVRHHPRAALHVAGAGVLQAGKAGIEEVTGLFGAGGEKSVSDEQPATEDRDGLSISKN